MANFTISPNMSLVVPTVGQQPGPQYANNVNADLLIIDGHDHTPGNGVQITPSGLNINATLSMQNNDLTTIRSLALSIQGAPLASSELNRIYDVLGNLYFNDGLGNQIPITANGAVAGSPGSIANLVAPASASYVSGNSTFVFQSNTATAANIDVASINLRNSTSNSFALTLQPPNAMVADYTLVLPTVPSVPSLVTLDASGNFGTIPRSSSPVISADCGLFQTSSTTFVTVTNLSVTITTTGRPVLLNLQSSGANSGSGFSRITLVGNQSTAQLDIRYTGTTLTSPSYSVANNAFNVNVIAGVDSFSMPSFLDTPPAGVHTYTVEVQVSSGSFTANVQCLQLVAFEL